jgi:hypothetical protein
MRVTISCKILQKSFGSRERRAGHLAAREAAHGRIRGSSSLERIPVKSKNSFAVASISASETQVNAEGYREPSPILVTT